jgi:hypothetical protein
MSNNLNSLADILIIQALFSEEDRFNKKAGIVEDFLLQAKSYFSDKIDKNNPTASVIGLLAPGAVAIAFRMMGFGKIGMLLGFLMNVFDIRVEKLVEPLCASVKSMVGSGQPISSDQVSAAAASAAAQYAPEQKQASFNELLHGARLLKLSAIEFEHETLRLTKEPMQKFAGAPGESHLVVNIISKMFGLIISVILWSAGLLVAGDIVRHFLGEPLSHTAEEAGPVSKQTKFKSKGEMPLSGSIHLQNTPENIDNMIVQFAKDVYDGLDGKETAIRNTAGFQQVKHAIVWYNQNNTGDAEIFLPAIFSSKKRMVDNFIDEVAA